MGIKQVLDFWFAGEPLGKEQMARWWQKNEKVDADIRARFSQLVDDIYHCMGDKWSETPEGRLAAIICLDQLPRNMYRNQPESFKYDDKALTLCKEGLDLQQHKSLPALWQSFFLMPLMHSENMDDQRCCLREFTALAAEADGQVKAYIENSMQFAQKHLDIIEQFGRYPHRNTILGRTSTEAEQSFLMQAGSSF